MVSDAYKSLIAAGQWGVDGDRASISSLGLTRTEGYPVAYEQVGSGSYPERTGQNQRGYEIDSALIDIADDGVPMWDAQVDYTPASDASCFVTTSTGLWVTDQNTGPTYGNATDPDSSGQTVWERY